MQHTIKNQWVYVVLIIAGLQLSACSETLQSKTNKIEPAHVEDIEGSESKRVMLSTKAMERLGIETDLVSEQHTKRRPKMMQKIVPYGALIYDPYGGTWVYTSPNSQTFVRHSIDVDFIEGDMVVLKDGPPVGTVIATVGVAELYGIEYEVGH